jgi:hypothetical protein
MGLEGQGGPHAGACAAIDPRFDDPGGWFNCSGTSGTCRLDQADDLAFLATFGITS